MKKSVKILIGVLCLVIVGLVIFIVVDKIINRKDKTPTMNIVAAENNTDKEDRTTPSENKTSDKSDKNEISNTTNNITSTDETKIANAAIRKALKEKDWIINNIIPVMFEQSTQNEALYNEHTFSFEKIENDDVPTYIVQAKAGYSLAVLISYKNGKVTVSQKCIVASAPGDEDEQVTINVKNGIARELPDSYDTQYNIYKINNGEFEPILNWDFGEFINGQEIRNYFYEGKKITGEEYTTRIEEYNNKYSYSEINKKLTDENIDKYVN